ncbi:MAG: type I-E CRISPR-associated protein Cas7/Cse4/CasC [Beijerinckiaceae bacterium]
MSRFLQIHSLTFHGPSNINRDDTGRPKTAMIGGVERLRQSSQAIKRAIRTSEEFARSMQGHLGSRTQRLGDDLLAALAREGIPADKALEAARAVASVFGKVRPLKDKEGKKSAKGKGKPANDSAADKPEKKDEAWIEQLAFVSPTERERAHALALRIANGENIDLAKETPLLHVDTAVDIAMFGRMLADNAQFNREAAVQVAHAFTTHEAVVESDYYTAMDDEKPVEEDVGAGFIGATGFGSGVYYSYVCINVELLTKNLGGDAGLARRAVEAFAHAFATVTPSGKINSFANHGRPGFILAERGDMAPRTLGGAFARAVDAENPMHNSITALKTYRENLNKAYGDCAEACKPMNVEKGEGSLREICAFLAEGVAHA